jgi:1,4-alpha-glucan branching enzyme
MLSRAPLFGGKNRITFSLPASEPAGAVSVVGDFNAWEPGRHELVPRRNGRRSVSVVLPPGEHRFRYLATDGVWLDDESADQVDPSGSWVRVHPRAPAQS